MELSGTAASYEPGFTGAAWRWLFLNRLWWFPDHLSYVEASSGLPQAPCPPYSFLLKDNEELCPSALFGQHCSLPADKSPEMAQT